MPNHLRLTLATSLIVLASFAVLNAQLATIPEQLAAAGGSLASGASIPSGLAPSIDHILSETDVIVTGIVGEPRSYLSDDQAEIYTDYTILDPVVLYQSDRVASKILNMPGIVATLVGGTISINGLSFTSRHDALPRLDPGSKCLLLLKAHSGRYHISGTYFGAFRINAGRLTPLTKKQGFAPEYTNAPIPQATKELVQHVGRLHRSA